jgi:SAM domain (Sterile alpha motif)
LSAISAFRDNDIDRGVLLKLTAEDLISIAVTSVGQRRKLLDAIAGLGMTAPTAWGRRRPPLVDRHKSAPSAGS